MSAVQQESAFTIAENKERAVLTRLFAQKGITDYSFTKVGSFKRYDFEFTKDGKTYVGDIKCRNIESTKHDTALFNKSKIDFLFNEGHRSDRIPLIIAFYSDNVIATWSIFREVGDMRSTTRQCTNTTSGTTAWDAQRVDNPVYLLKLDNASKTQLQ